MTGSLDYCRQVRVNRLQRSDGRLCWIVLLLSAWPYVNNNGNASRWDLALFPVFICSYMFLAPVFGYLGDRYNRKIIMSVGISFWSLVTLASSYTPREVSHVLRFLFWHHFLKHWTAVTHKHGLQFTGVKVLTLLCFSSRSASGSCCWLEVWSESARPVTPPSLPPSSPTSTWRGRGPTCSPSFISPFLSAGGLIIMIMITKVTLDAGVSQRSLCTLECSLFSSGVLWCSDPTHVSLQWESVQCLAASQWRVELADKNERIIMFEHKPVDPVSTMKQKLVAVKVFSLPLLLLLVIESCGHSLQERTHHSLISEQI